MIDLGEKKDGICSVQIRTPLLVPVRDMKELRGNFYELTDKNYYKDINTDDYFRIILTNEEDIIGAMSALRAIYPRIMRLDYDNTRTKTMSFIPEVAGSDSRSPLEIFSSLYDSQNGKPMDEEQTELISSLIEKIRSEEK